MNKEQFNINIADPELPKAAREAARNHGGMTVPEGFFEQFERKMNAVIDAENLLHESQPAIQPVAKPSGTHSIGRSWIAAAAAVAVVLVVGIFYQFNRIEDKIIQSGIMAEAESPEEELLNPMEDVYYTSLSDYEVYDLICGL